MGMRAAACARRTSLTERRVSSYLTVVRNVLVVAAVELVPA
jgi:hypothetical protein